MDSRLGQLGGQRGKNQDESDPDLIGDGRMPNFTPGRIRASRMNNNFLSPVNAAGPPLITPQNKPKNRVENNLNQVLKSHLS